VILVRVGAGRFVYDDLLPPTRVVELLLGDGVLSVVVSSNSSLNRAPNAL
jgi:hypothetical protein